MKKEFQLFLDLDGVLADFDQKFIDLVEQHPREYEAINGRNSIWPIINKSNIEFFYELDKMHDADELYDAVKHLNPIGLTGANKGDRKAADQKTRWIEKHFPGMQVIVTESKNKRLHMHEDKWNIIVDDWHRYRHLWEEHDGTWILHTSAKQSIQDLKDLGIL